MGNDPGTSCGKKTEQLNTLFGHVLAGIYIEPEYTTQYFRFYHAGKRITYEDVIQAALEAKEAVQKERKQTRNRDSGIKLNGRWRILFLREQNFHCQKEQKAGLAITFIKLVTAAQNAKKICI